MALPTAFLKVKNAVSKGKTALKNAKNINDGEQFTNSLISAVKNSTAIALSTLVLPIITIAGIVFFVIVVYMMMTSIPVVVFGDNLNNSESNSGFCNEDPSKAEYAYEPLKGGLAIPHYRQLDNRWKNDRMWDVDHGRWTTIGDYGCASAAFSMVASYLLDQKIYPDAVSRKIGADKQGGMNAWQGSYGPVSDMYGIEKPKHTTSWSEIKEAVNNNQPVIMHYYDGGVFTNTGHFVVIRGMTSDGKFLVNDPSDNQSDKKKNYINRKFTEAEMQNGFDWGVIFKAKVCANGSGIGYLQWAIDIANDDSHGYSQCNRNGPDYDCSSLVWYALFNSGYTKKELGGYPFNVSRERIILPQIGFREYVYVSESELQAGDILVKGGEHTAMYVGNGKIVHASSSREGNGICGRTGDQDGKEVLVADFYGGWTHYYRKK